MSRDRHQDGWVEECGGRVKKWRGHYYVYERQADGSEKRRHRSLILGPRARLKKWEAEQALRQVIRRETPRAAPAAEITLAWFWRERFLPLKGPGWKESARKEMAANIERYVITGLGERPLAALDKFMLQNHINTLAERYSRSVVEKALIWSRAILEEAVDQEFLDRNPARKLAMPQCRKVARPTLAPERIADAFALLPLRERLMLRLALVLGLRPGEILALRWNDVGAEALRIDEGTVDGRVYEPKTEASAAWVWLPAEVRAELELWRGLSPAAAPESFVFPAPAGGVMRLDNYRRRMFRPALERAGLRGVTFQQCRRSCATLLLDGRHGNLKDIQAHLRHARATTTLEVYVQAVPASVRAAVESLDRAVFGAAGGEGRVN